MIRTALAAVLAATLSLPVAAQEAETLGWAMKPALAGLDLDGDGAYLQSEIGSSTVPEAFDLDRDGAYTLSELSQGYFAANDRNDDGYLDQDELAAMRGLAAAGVYQRDF